MSIENETAVADSIKRMAKVGSCWSPTFSPDGLELAFISDMTGSPQVWRLPSAGGFPRAVTAFDEQISEVTWSPAGDWLAVQAAPGGGMNSQIDIVRPDGSGRKRITPGGSTNNWLNCWSPDGSAVYFSSNMDDGNSMDSYCYAMASAETGRIAANDGTGVVEDVAPDGKRVLISRVAYRGDNNVFLRCLDNDEERLLTEHAPPSSFSNARFSHDASCVYMVSNRGRDLAGFVSIPLEAGAAWEIVQARDNAELDQFAISSEGKLAALVWNCAGRHELELVDLAGKSSVSTIDLPGEIVDSLSFSADGTKLALTASGAKLPPDIFLLETADHSLRQLTVSSHIGVDLGALAGRDLARVSCAR